MSDIVKAENLPQPQQVVQYVDPIERFQQLDLNKIERIAALVEAAGIVPTTLNDQDKKTRQAKICVAILYGLHVGLNPFQALTSVVVINGQPTLRAEALLALCYRSGLLESIEEKIEGGVATVTVKRKGFSPITRSFSLEDAKRAGLADKQNWRQYPERMLINRARAFALRDAFPDVVKGLYVTEEMAIEPEPYINGEILQGEHEEFQEIPEILTKEDAWDIICTNKSVEKFARSASSSIKSLQAAIAALPRLSFSEKYKKALSVWLQATLAEKEEVNDQREIA